tara:strand:+ start:6870 stop:9125 length:2256 start_codon:yes stop_codon:yes gene_type:complete
MHHSHTALSVFLLLPAAQAQQVIPETTIPAPPTPPAIEERAPTRQAAGFQPQGAAPTLYSIGQPTDDEQHYLELINRARRDPTGEATRMAIHTDPQVQSAMNQFNVNTTVLHAAISAYPVAQPLAMNSNMIVAARRHTGDQFTNTFQGHTGTDGTDTGDRLTDAGYIWQRWGENVFSFARSAVHGHAGFEIDWGNGPNGMQDPPGHRNTIHHVDMREIGIGVVNDSKTGSNQTSVGPQLVTQNFGEQQNPTPFITGVAYFDLNSNGEYDAGEGLGGINVAVAGASFFAITADAGGYAVPVPSNGVYQVTFSGANFSDYQTNVTVANNLNVKADFVPVFSAPVVSGSASPTVGVNNTYNFTTVTAATSYEWKHVSVTPVTQAEGAENGTNGLVLEIGSYDPVVSDSVNSGSAAFRLAHTAAVAGTEIIQLPQTFRPTASSQLQFAKRMALTHNGQTARAEISTDSGTSWTTLWEQTGDGNSESSFSAQVISLAAHAGTPILVRFTFELSAGSFFQGSNSGFGFYFDDVLVSNADILGTAIITPIASGTSFEFNPPSAGSYALAVRALNNARQFVFGATLDVTAVTGPAPPVITGQPAGVVTNAGAQVTLSVTATGAGLGYQWKKDGNSVNGGTGSSLVLTTANRASGGSFTVEVTNAGGAVTSVPAVVRVRVAQQLEFPQILGGGAGARLLFMDQDGGQLATGDIANFMVQVSSDLTNWTNLSGLTINAGKIQVDDADAASQSNRFYRVFEQ